MKGNKALVRGVGFVLLVVLTMVSFQETAWAGKYDRSKTESGFREKGGKGKTERMTANTKNLKWDTDVKNTAYKAQLAELKNRGIKVDNNTQMVSRLRNILARLKKKSLIPDLPYEVHYVDHETVNAVCYPGGGILFFKGLFDKKNGLVNPASDDEIGAVMGHEIAHATLRHAYKKQKTVATVGVLGSVASVAVEAAGGADVGNLFDVVFDVGTGLYFPSYSRKHEAEADLEGLYTMMNAGYKGEKAVALWERAAKQKGSKSSIYASHPSSGKRAKDLAKHLENIKNHRVAQR